MRIYIQCFVYTLIFKSFSINSTVYNYCKFVDIDESVLQGEMSVAHFVGGQLYSRVDLFLNKQIKIIRDVSL